jgi:hypothetical protein
MMEAIKIARAPAGSEPTNHAMPLARKIQHGGRDQRGRAYGTPPPFGLFGVACCAFGAASCGLASTGRKRKWDAQNPTERGARGRAGETNGKGTRQITNPRHRSRRDQRRARGKSLGPECAQQPEQRGNEDEGAE